MEDTYRYKDNPNIKVKSPLEPGNPPELDTSPFLDKDDTQIYQSLISAMQWVISIGRWNMMRVKQMYGYLIKFCYKIRFRTDEPNYGSTPIVKHDWSNTSYGNGEEPLPDNAPTPKGRGVVLSHWYDANLMHIVLSGKSVKGVFHMANMTPMMWYSKQQVTAETATYGAEFLSARTCFEQIIDLQNSFWYLGVAVCENNYVWGDNELQVKSSIFNTPGYINDTISSYIILLETWLPKVTSAYPILLLSIT